MSSGEKLIERFVVQKLDDSVRSILKDAFDERKRSKSILLREFEFNCFDVSLDFEKSIVTLQDVLSSEEGNTINVPMRDFISACGFECLLLVVDV
ncbi:hypothetical protein IFT37_19240 [Pseudomonas fluorescens]|uniref:hypothetical protein n=1 Tax=Pseudomonas fluorescens TaxID=294 RepID=UPI0017868086|nr:hypothetical protein [Pseudomonas fluorescens]MBD8147842.1 hypothetical protein [Pseudomonas fluorescens]MBD8177740.1 hypothetical protein [Pseudomonas fluorescens]MBD8747247.1 hypothetical protein [Pseudomonas fluorescens]MBD8751003.1 hypothetical protein [Pseudomonas fluorescens]MBD8760509.1 hypothetical protein [Pseudomonas fluorescens]